MWVLGCGGSLFDGVGVAEAVSDAADGFDHFGVFAEFFSEAAHVGVDGAGVDDGFVSPDVVEEDFAAEDGAFAFDECGEEAEFCGGEGEGGFVDVGGVFDAVDGDGAALEDGVGDALSAAEDGFDAEDEFAWAEGFDDVVVCAEFEAEDAVDFGGFGCEYDDGDVFELGVFADLFADFGAAHAGHHDVEDDEVDFFFFEGLEGFGAVVDFDGVVSFVCEG